MIVERTFHCSRSGCDAHLTTLREWPATGVLTCDLDGAVLGWYCSWDCVMFAAGERSPLEQMEL